MPSSNDAAEIPEPYPGLVIRYSYLWRRQFLAGREDGDKDRPCAIIIAARSEHDGAIRVTVLPITHAQPDEGDRAIEIPAATKRRLGLDGKRSWIVLSETNRFRWPGPDLRRAGPANSFAYGDLPPKFLNQVLKEAIHEARRQRLTVIPRTE